MQEKKANPHSPACTMMGGISWPQVTSNTLTTSKPKAAPLTLAPACDNPACMYHHVTLPSDETGDAHFPEFKTAWGETTLKMYEMHVQGVTVRGRFCLACIAIFEGSWNEAPYILNHFCMNSRCRLFSVEFNYPYYSIAIPNSCNLTPVIYSGLQFTPLSPNNNTVVHFTREKFTCPPSHESIYLCNSCASLLGL